MIDFFVSMLVVLLGLMIANSNKINVKLKDRNHLKKLWIYHLGFTIIFYFYTQNNSADANGYWRVAKKMSEYDLLYHFNRGPGTHFMYIINYIPANILDLSIFTGMVLYSLLGFIGLYCFYQLADQLIRFNVKIGKLYLFPFLFYLPNIHFWSAGVGKDTLLFFLIGVMGLALKNKKWLILGLSLLLAYFVRPHIAFLLIISFFIVFLLSSNIKNIKKALLSLTLLGALFSILPYILEYISIDELNANNLLERLETQSGHLSGKTVGSSVNISSYPLILKLFTFLYRPLFFDAAGIMALIASFENLILLGLSIKIIANKPIAAFKSAPIIIKGYTVFILLGSILFSFSLSNLGIILRMKNMFIPGFLLYLMWGLSDEICRRRLSKEKSIT